jgi:hypothetical protein
MPKATVSLQSQRFELETLPEGFVVLQRMSFGQKLTRQGMATNQIVKADTVGKDGGLTELEIELMQLEVARYEFAHCIVEHNLEDENGVMLNFNYPQAVESLDPRIGDEISQYIADMNNYEKNTDQAGNSQTASKQPSS